MFVYSEIIFNSSFSRTQMIKIITDSKNFQNIYLAGGSAELKGYFPPVMQNRKSLPGKKHFFPEPV